DTTGSMEFDTICYGCWARCGDNGLGYNGNNADLIDPADCTAADRYKPFPQNGRAFPFDYDSATMQSLITGNGGQPKPEGANDYIILEAEFYSDNNSSWDPAFRAAGQGYWAIQRDWEARAYSVDGYGYGGNSLTDPPHLSGLVRHHPYLTLNGGNPFGRDYTLADAQNNIAPSLEYDFIPTWSGVPTHVHFRAQVFNNTNQGFYWTIEDQNGTQVITVNGKSGGGDNGGNWNVRNNWTWVRDDTGAITLTQGLTHTLKIWAGSAGYAFDRIIITSRSDIDNSPGPDLRDLPATPGTAQRLAADPCNPIFGRSVSPFDCTYRVIFESINNLNDPLFTGHQPFQGIQQAVKNFITYLDPRYDQVGLVDFANDGWQRSQLECLTASMARTSDIGPGNQIANYPLSAATYGEYDELTCFDPGQAAPGTVPINYTNVLIGLEDAYPSSGNTDIADGIRRGLHMLGINTDNDDGGQHANDCAWDADGSTWRLPLLSGAWLNQPGIDTKADPVVSHCGRGQSVQPVMILFSDGPPTNSPPGDNDDCTHWGDSNPPPYVGFPIGNDRYECTMYYADIAADNGVPVCTIGIGVGPDVDLLQAIADRTNGQALFVPFTIANTYLAQQFVLYNCLRDFSISKTLLGSGTVEAGQIIVYSLTITNPIPPPPPYGWRLRGPSHALAISNIGSVTATVVDSWTPPEAVAGVDAPGCEVNLGGGVITCTQTNLVPGTPTRLPFTFTTSAVFTGTLTNTARISHTDVLHDYFPENNSSDPITVNVLYTPPSIFVNGGNQHMPGDTITINLVDHEPNTSYDVYIDDNLIATAATNASGSAVVPYTIPADISPAGLEPENAHIVASKRSNTEVATINLFIIVPELTLSKSAPATVAINELITYTLTVTNSGPATATYVVVTDTISTDAKYISGGTKVGEVVSWTIATLAAHNGVTHSTFFVTATQTITNRDYRVTAEGGYSATGTVSVVTIVSNSISDTGDIYLPIILK
ncbi:MAG: DUF11 domain-containing protein, partial [Chloroflexi bacterium]|nr:DUF11 domain-containing protein [Chloroflexota bacterium]